MKMLKLEFEMPKGLFLSPDEEKKTPVQLAKDTIKNVILALGMSVKGFKEDERRLYYKICDKLEAKNEDGSEKAEIEFEDQEFGFIKRAFRDGGLMPNPLLRKIEDCIAATPDR
jgi:hypothetical protein